jgi:hypothetical protein
MIPAFDRKKRIRQLYRTCPPRAAVICFDEWGPLELRPLGGRAWAHRRRPQRMRATYHRRKGTEQFLGFYDVHADCLSGLFRRHKRVADVSEAFCRLRACYPRRRLFVIMDNLHHVHDHPRFLALPRRLHIHPVWTPTDLLAQRHRGPLRRDQARDPDRLDDPEHVTRQRRLYRYLRYRNRRVHQAAHPLTCIRSVRRIKLERH